ncbi:hypothetical protein CCR83_08345 [Rhodobacter veldkampii DSM 11550]|uniref:hypothetical protein n=1 Tax=Phaeovulum veldkampii TaxID=33049 RepID=UPI00105FE87E|nr:hypothetical protein [Phaeovulum veldkampii]MBK5946442.1 hypothetical protein [Phaeovulum veldkampii DSM 11550]TDQ54509.1 hypothetical protein EV658_13514 [Phaeovulum veldkampii DSM 11550]
MGRGGYLGGGTILRIWPKLRKARKNAPAVDAKNYDFEARAEEIRQDIEARKQMIAEGRNPLDFEGPSVSQKRMIAKKARKKAKKKTKRV